MDARTLLYRCRSADEEDLPRKKIALRTAHAIAQAIDPSITASAFMDRAANVVKRVYGGSAQDSYITTTMSLVSNFSENIDVYLAAVINALVVQLNFQTRIFLDGNQFALFDGQDEYFALAMLHGNVTMGIHLTPEARQVTLPRWANISPALEINADRMHHLPPDLVPIYQKANGCRSVGTVLVVNPSVDSGEFSLAERYSFLQGSVTQDTTFCVAGPAEMVFHAAADLQRMHPQAQLNLKAYRALFGRAEEYRAIMLFSGLDAVPEIVVRPGLSRPCEFDLKLVDLDENLTSVSYGNDTIAGRRNSEADGPARGVWEKAAVKAPFHLSSSAPLPAEARERISSEFEIFHSSLAIRDGILIPSQDAHHCTFLYATGEGRVLNDYGSDPSVTPIYTEGWLDEQGVRHGILHGRTLKRVRGPAMPLMFTPLLHKWHSHFMIQCLPRIRIVRDLGLDMTILLPDDMRKKQLEMLERLGFGPSKIVMMAPDELVQADMLYYPWPWRLGFTTYTSKVYDEIAAGIETSHIISPKRILISRESRKSWRNLINYDSVRHMLVEDFGFEVISPEKLSLSEEIAAYANAEVVVGAEGAGLYGAVFSGPKTKYITVCDEDYVMPILGSLAAIRGFDIGYVFGESFRSDRDVERRLPFGHADFIIDVDRLSQAVRHAISP
ncbi:MAG: glycosyltransferase family 61 protein [Sneathiella sp.]|jgi:hypothetical protein|nr:glycosyltransferase family 61 protein [Sneathiella sp.]